MGFLRKSTKLLSGHSQKSFWMIELIFVKAPSKCFSLSYHLFIPLASIIEIFSSKTFPKGVLPNKAFCQIRSAQSLVPSFRPNQGSPNEEHLSILRLPLTGHRRHHPAPVSSHGEAGLRSEGPAAARPSLGSCRAVAGFQGGFGGPWAAEEDIEVKKNKQA